ncbi:MAG: hypothetical protein K8L91_04830 [Anaerolineae bacterium]|nr:hypothetical protein [Anaerolineae bacterium]
MLPTDQVMLTLARRTKVNLDYVYASKSTGNVFEFTQLINSMLSLVISMRAEYFSDRKPVTWEEVFKEIRSDRLAEILGDLDKGDLKLKGNEVHSKSPKLKQSKEFSELIDRLRNAFAHCCFKLFGQSEIQGLEVWNVAKEEDRLEKDKRLWEASISEAQLRAIAYLFIEYLEVTRGHEFSGR